jgi:hypothetical protein
MEKKFCQFFAYDGIYTKNAKKIILESISFALNFDLVAPSFNDMQMITLEQKNQMSYSSGIPTSKTLGFSVPNENIDNY